MTPPAIHRRALLCGLAALAATPALAWDQWPQPQLRPMPGMQALNLHVLDIVRSYPFGDAHPYKWTADKHTDGTTRDLDFQGVSLARANPEGGVHCSGITFEVWLQALERTGVPSWLTSAELLKIKSTWYVRDGNRQGPVSALASRGLGVELPGIADLEPGDIVQFWRNSGRGHSAIFLDHRRRRDGSVRGLAFWSAQSASDGIGIRYASFGSGADNLAAIHGVRPVRPVG